MFVQFVLVWYFVLQNATQKTQGSGSILLKASRETEAIAVEIGGRCNTKWDGRGRLGA